MSAEELGGASGDELLDRLREIVLRGRDEGAQEVRVAVEPSTDETLAELHRLGFSEARVELVADLGDLERRLSGDVPTMTGSVHVQTDDQAAVAQAVERFVPRTIAGSTATVVSAATNGWIGVYDDIASRDGAQLRRLASELSNVMGGVVISLSAEAGAVVRLVAFERGRMMDEYLSVPEYYGSLPSGDVMALRANPTLLGRLTGVPAGSIRAVARTADSPAELPPADELLAQIAEVLRIPNVGLGFDEASALPDAATVPHA